MLKRLRDRLGAPVVSAGLVLIVLVSVLALPRVSAATYAYGLAFGAANAIAAMGVVLLYRSSRIVNFAQVALGAVSAMLFEQLVQYASFARVWDQACGGCLNGQAGVTALDVNYWLSAGVAILVAPLLAGVVYLVFIRRFRRATPLVATVLTVALASLLTYLASPLGPLPPLFNPNVNPNATQLLGPNLAPPLHVSLALPGHAFFNAGQVILIAFALVSLGALTAFLRFTRMGVAIRAVAEEPERAASLGIPDLAVQLTVWMIAGLLAGSAAVIGSIASGALAGTASPSTLTRVFAAGILADMQSLPLAFLASVAFASLDQAFFGAFNSSALIDAAVFGAILLALLVRPQARRQRHDPTEAAWTSAREIRPTPRALNRLSTVVRWKVAVALAIVIVLVGVPWVLPPGETDGVTVYVIYGMVGLSLLLVTGWAGQISAGQFAFAACGAFVAAVLAGRYDWPFVAAVLAGGASGAALAVAVGIPALRVRGLYLAVTSLAFAVACANVLLSPDLGGRFLPDSLARPQLLGLDGEDEKTFYYFMLLVVAICVVAVLGMRRSRTGRAVIATRDNSKAAESFGIGVLRARTEILAVSGFIAATAGALFAFQEHGVRIGSYGADVSLNMLQLVIIGGLGSVAGPLLGAAYLAVSGTVNVVFAAVGPGAAVLFLLYVAPGGLSQLGFSVRDVFLRRVAERFRIEVPSLAGARWRADARMPIAPKVARGGGVVFVEQRYRLPGDPRLRVTPTARPAAK